MNEIGKTTTGGKLYAISKKVKLREVNEAAAKYATAQQRYGDNNMETQRAEIAYRDLKSKWEEENGRRYTGR